MEGAPPSHRNPQRQPACQTLPRSQHVLWARDLQCLGAGACSRLGPEARTAPSTWGGVSEGVWVDLAFFLVS